jgi:2-desacetyl-2-hydroxyethyl bacteriochlorophyllide A dehydrogenase
VKAIQLVAQGVPGKFELRDLPDPQPGPGEVVVEVKACGLNHLDLWLESAGLPVQIPMPRTPGGEVSGVVCALGANVNGWSVGDRVAVQSNLFCGDCEFCRRGDESICLKGGILGVTRDGGFAEKVSVPVSSLVKLPEGVDFRTSAALTLAGSTAMHMLTNRAQVNRGDWVLVMGGTGGVGSVAVQIAKQFGAKVITTGSTEEKRKRAAELGADHVLDTHSDWPAEVRRITNRRGVDLVVEHVGGDVLQKCFDCLVRGGTIVTCGATAGREVPFNLWPFFVKQHRLIGSYGRNRSDILATLEWAAAGRIQAAIDSIVPLEETASAFAKLRARKVQGKLVIVPQVPR